METPTNHHIGEENAAYRRGMVLGLTMAEVGILIIFVLLLLIGLGETLRAQQANAMKGLKPVDAERLVALEQSDSQLTQLRNDLQLPTSTGADEISTLVRTLKEITATPKGQSTLKETRGALEEMRRVKEALENESGSEALAKEVERQSYRIGNQEGQLQRCEARLQEAGLGKGERPCWVKPDGTIEYLYDVVLASNGIRLREYHHIDRTEQRRLLPMPSVDPTEALGPAEFLERTRFLYEHSRAINCRFFVVVYDATGPTEKELYKTLLRTVEGHFYKRLTREPAPF